MIICTTFLVLFLSNCTKDDVEPKRDHPIDVTYYNFEDSTAQGLEPDNCEEFPYACAEITTIPVRMGKYALKFRLEGIEKERSEVTMNDSIIINTNYWVGFSNYLLMWDNTDENSVIYQTHRASGQPGSSPIVGLRATGSEWELTQEFDTSKSKRIWTAPIDKNEWVDWVLHVNYTTSNNGIVELYKNGELVYSYSGRTLVEGTTIGPYDKFGIYQGVEEATGLRELVYDEIKYANDRDAIFSDVKPN